MLNWNWMSRNTLSTSRTTGHGREASWLVTPTTLRWLPLDAIVYEQDSRRTPFQDGWLQRNRPHCPAILQVPRQERSVRTVYRLSRRRRRQQSFGHCTVVAWCRPRNSLSVDAWKEGAAAALPPGV